MRSDNWNSVDTAHGGQISALARELIGALGMPRTLAETLALMRFGYSHEEIAAIRALSVETVYNQISIIREQLAIPALHSIPRYLQRCAGAARGSSKRKIVRIS